ncbi:hypothetical protein [Sporomusa sp.]|uniref:hypothetical protein n=1 Tax=Sporomusa sp. TaxID=2078658 RepID=UPI002D0B4897|nr:hypothetical protein [Sporomusa sp.]HWR42269.1 hypothetical protein [Sporomusa sp.]
MYQLPKPFQPNASLLSENPFKPGQPVPDPYDYEPQAHSLPTTCLQLNTDEQYQNPFESSETYSKRTGAQLVAFVDPALKANTLPVLSAKTTDSRVLGDKFVESNSNLYVLINDQKVFLANFVMRVTDRICRKTISSSTEHVTVNILNGTSEATLSLPLIKYKGLLAEIKSKYPEFRLNANFSNSYAFFSEYASLVYEESLGTLTYATTYEYAGWENVNGKMVYLSQRLPYCCSTRYVWEVSPCDILSIYRQGLNFLSVSKEPKTILPLFLYAHVGYTAQLFETAGHEVQFILMVVGKTGSFKTSVCKELFQAFNTEKFLNFQSTARAIELQRNECRDMTLLLDDIFSSKDTDAIKKFADVLRVFGDNASKAKSNAASTKIERFDVRGAAVVTGENDLNTQQSSRLRYLTVPVDNTSFDAEKLRMFQNNTVAAKMQNQPSIIQHYFSAYIHYLEDNYNDIVYLITQTDNYIKPLDIKFPRLNMIYRVMIATAHIVVRFGLTYGAISEADAETMLSCWEDIIRTVILENQADSTTCEPHIAYLEALAQGFASGDIKLANDKENYFQNGRDYIGFIDNQHGKMFLDYQKAFRFVEKYYSELRVPFASTATEVHKVLYEKGFSEGYQESSGRPRYLKKVSYDNQKLQALCLKCVTFETLVSK